MAINYTKFKKPTTEKCKDLLYKARRSLQVKQYTAFTDAFWKAFHFVVSDIYVDGSNQTSDSQIYHLVFAVMEENFMGNDLNLKKVVDKMAGWLQNRLGPRGLKEVYISRADNRPIDFTPKPHIKVDLRVEMDLIFEL